MNQQVKIYEGGAIIEGHTLSVPIGVELLHDEGERGTVIGVTEQWAIVRTAEGVRVFRWSECGLAAEDGEWGEDLDTNEDEHVNLLRLATELEAKQYAKATLRGRNDPDVEQEQQDYADKIAEACAELFPFQTAKVPAESGGAA